MTNEEIRQKAIKCGKAFETMCKSREYETDEDFNTICHCKYNEVANVTSCSAVYGYEHGFSDGVEEGKNQTTLAKLDIDEQYEVSNRIEAEIRAESLAEALKPYDAESVEDLVRNVRKKTIEEFFRRLNLKFVESPLDDFVVRDILGEIKKIAMQMKEGGEND